MRQAHTGRKDQRESLSRKRQERALLTQRGPRPKVGRPGRGDKVAWQGPTNGGGGEKQERPPSITINYLRIKEQQMGQLEIEDFEYMTLLS